MLHWWSLAYSPTADLFYTVVEDSIGEQISDLLSVTPSGVITPIGATNLSITAGLAYDTNNDTLYAESGSNLYTINTSTGAPTLVGSLGVAFNALADLACDPSTDTLFLNAGSSLNSLYTVNRVTGAATLVGVNGPTTGHGIDGIALLAAPEPATLALLGLGLADCRLLLRSHEWLLRSLN